MNGALTYIVSLWLFQNKFLSTASVNEEIYWHFIRWVYTMVNFKYLRMKLTNQNRIHEALKSGWIHGMLAIFKFIIFLLPICCQRGMGIKLSLSHWQKIRDSRVFKTTTLRKILGPKMTKLQDEELHLKVKWQNYRMRSFT